MDDAETPPAPGNGKGDQTRRASLKLRDAEAVATTRRDMFGDGSLIDVLAGSREDEPSLLDAAPAEPADAPESPPSNTQPEDDQGQETQLQDAPQDEAPQEVQSYDAQPPAPAHEAPAEQTDALEPPYSDPQPVNDQTQETQPPDAYQNEGPQEPPDPSAQEAPFALTAVEGSSGNNDRAQDELDGPEPVSTSNSPQSLDAIIDSFPAEPPAAEGGEGEPPGFNFPPVFPAHRLDTAGLRRGQTPVSAIFNTLETVREPVEEPADPAAVAPEPPGADMPGNGTPSPDRSEPDEIHTVDATTVEDSAQDVPLNETGEAPSHPADPDVPQLPEPSPTAGGAEPAWPPFPEPPGSEAVPQFPEHPPAAGEAEPAWPPLPEPTVVPPFIELPIGNPGLAPFSGPPPAAAGATPEWPPLIEPPGAGPEAPSAPIASGMPPYIELPAEPADTSQIPAESPPDYPSLPEHLEAPHPGASDGPHFPDPTGHDPEGRQPALDETADTSEEATAKIAAEATATAQALDSLQRLLDQSIPDTVPTQRPVRSDAAPGRRPVQSHGPLPNERAGPRGSRAPSRRRPSDRPLRLPRNDTGSGTSVYLLGFLTGVGLSLMAGLALYFLISTS